MSSYCVKCRAHTQNSGKAATKSISYTTKTGKRVTRKVLTGKCKRCGTKKTKFI